MGSPMFGNLQKSKDKSRVAIFLGPLFFRTFAATKPAPALGSVAQGFEASGALDGLGIFAFLGVQAVGFRI